MQLKYVHFFAFVGGALGIDCFVFTNVVIYYGGSISRRKMVVRNCSRSILLALVSDGEELQLGKLIFVFFFL